MEVILKNKMGGNYPPSSSVAVEVDPASGTVYSHAHKFEKYNYSTPTSCNVCHSLLWGPRTGLRYDFLEVSDWSTMYNFHNSTDTLKFWTEKWAILMKLFCFSSNFDETLWNCSTHK